MNISVAEFKEIMVKLNQAVQDHAIMGQKIAKLELDRNNLAHIVEDQAGTIKALEVRAMQLDMSFEITKQNTTGWNAWQKGIEKQIAELEALKGTVFEHGMRIQSRINVADKQILATSKLQEQITELEDGRKNHYGYIERFDETIFNLGTQSKVHKNQIKNMQVTVNENVKRIRARINHAERQTEKITDLQVNEKVLRSDFNHHIKAHFKEEAKKELCPCDVCEAKRAFNGATFPSNDPIVVLLENARCIYETT